MSNVRSHEQQHEKANAVTPGTQGYAEQAAELIERYEELGFTEKHQEVLHLLPEASAYALDIGAGTGADAAWLANRGHGVVAVEPTDALRAYGVAHHASPLIEWVNDSLPELEQVVQRRQKFGLIMLTAVWMHLDFRGRQVAMPRLAALLENGGVILMTLRHGPVPPGRLMFAVSAEETVALAVSRGLECVLKVTTESKLAANRAAGVVWSCLAFKPQQRDT